MRSVLIAIFVVSLASASQAAPRNDPGADNGTVVVKHCRDMVGKETTEGEGRAHIGQLQAQRFSECVIGMRT